MNILIVGAGAVGQVYGYYLARGGANVSFLVKDKYRETALQGFPLYEIGFAGQPRLHLFTEFDVLTRVEDAATMSWDQIWITVASDALLGDWLGLLTDNLPVSTQLVYLQPDLKDRDIIASYVEPSQIIQGVIQFMAYQSPLPDEADPQRLQEKGVSYFIPPPIAMTRLAPDTRATQDIVQLLKRAGVRVSLSENLQFSYAFTAAISIPVMACLETIGWSFKRFREAASQHRARHVVAEAVRVVCAYHNRPYYPWLHGALIAVVVKVMAYAEPFAPFALQRQIKFHFSKVGAQTRLMLQSYQAQGAVFAADTGQLAALANDIKQLDGNYR